MGLLFGAVRIVDVLLPNPAHTRELNKRALCAENFITLEKGLFLYARDNGDRMPPTLQATVQYLTKAGLAGDSALQCPAARTHSDSDYFYFPPDPKDEPKATILICDYKNNHEDTGRNVLFADYHMGWVYETAFQTELKNPCNATFAKTLREAEGP